MAAQVLVKLGADLNRVRQQVLQLLSGYQGLATFRGSRVPRGESVRTVRSCGLVLFLGTFPGVNFVP